MSDIFLIHPAAECLNKTLEPDLLRLLSCPVTQQPLRAATREELKSFAEGLDEGLIREDGRVLYPVKNGIPLLVPDAAISLTA